MTKVDKLLKTLLLGVLTAVVFLMLLVGIAGIGNQLDEYFKLEYVKSGWMVVWFTLGCLLGALVRHFVKE